MSSRICFLMLFFVFFSACYVDREEYEKLNQDYQDAMNAKAQAELKIKNIQTESSRLNDLLRLLNDQARRISLEGEELDRELRNSENDVDVRRELKDRLNEIEIKLVKLKQEADELLTEKNISEDALKANLAQIESLKSDLLLKDKQIADLRRQMDELRADNKSQKIKIDNLYSTIQSLNRERQILNEMVDSKDVIIREKDQEIYEFKKQKTKRNVYFYSSKNRKYHKRNSRPLIKKAGIDFLEQYYINYLGDVDPRVKVFERKIVVEGVNNLAITSVHQLYPMLFRIESSGDSYTITLLDPETFWGISSILILNEDL